MENEVFGERKSFLAPHKSDVFSLIPTILFYMERERFVDANVACFSIRWLMWEYLVLIKTKVKD